MDTRHKNAMEGGTSEQIQWYLLVHMETRQQTTSVSPYMDKAEPIASVYLVAIFIVEESSDVFQSICNSASYSRSLDMLPRVANFAPTTRTSAAIIHERTIGCFYFCKALPCQDIADIDRTSCSNCEKI